MGAAEKPGQSESIPPTLFLYAPRHPARFRLIIGNILIEMDHYTIESWQAIDREHRPDGAISDDGKSVLCVTSQRPIS